MHSPSLALCNLRRPYPNPNSDAETALVAVLNITSAFLWTYVLALFCDVVTNSDPALTLFRQRLDGLNLFIRVHGINSQFAQRLRRFMHQQKGVQLREDAKLALPQLSPALRVEIMMLVHRDWLVSRLPRQHDATWPCHATTDAPLPR